VSTYDEILAAARDSEPADMDLSYLESFRKGGAAALGEHRERSGYEGYEEQYEAVELDADRSQPDEVEDLNLQAEIEGGPGLELDEDFDGLAELDEPELDRDGDERRAKAGSSATASVVSGAPAGTDETAIPSALAQQEAVEADTAHEAAREASTVHRAEQADHDGDLIAPIPLQLTDHQEAVQAAARCGNRGNSSDDVDAAGIPRMGFSLLGAGSQPNIKALPEVVVEALRTQVISVLVDQGVAEAAARTSVKQMGQNTLVMAFLIAQLDVHVDVDAKTATVAALFRHKNPLLGALMERMTALELTSQRQLNETAKATKEIAAVKQTSAVLEQAVAYSIADRTENLARGLRHVDDLDLTHTSALRARDRVREETKKQQRTERDREGRSGTY
jgi:hypothetical protein